MRPPLERLVIWATYAGCRKSKRSAIIVSRDGREFCGNNGPAVGECDGSEHCRRDCSRICIHAEQAALIEAGEAARGGEAFHLKVVSGRAVASGAPSCVDCSKLMLTAGVSGVWLLQESGWRRWTAEEFHRATLATLALKGA